MPKHPNKNASSPRSLAQRLVLVVTLVIAACLGSRSALLTLVDGDKPPQKKGTVTSSKPTSARVAGLLDPDPIEGGFVNAVDGASLPLRPTDTGLKVAFIGDQGLVGDGLSVLELIRDEGADFVIHAGDFDYLNDPAAWDAQIDATLGEGYPYFVSVGNHDLPAWAGADGYQDRVRARLSQIDDVVCAGDLGVNSSCRYRGLFFVLSGVGTLGEHGEDYLRAALAQDRSMFRICSWHKNQHDMQVGSKTDEVGWGAYQVCQEQGALIINGHEHSYARTLNLTDVGNVNAGHGALGDPAHLLLAPKMTAVIVSGLGGHSHRPFTQDHEADTWWASIYALNLQVKNGVTAGTDAEIESGALFIEFNVDGDPSRAHGYFKTIGHKIVDDFDVTRSLDEL